MFTTEAGRREAWRRARECALGLLAGWLVLQNAVLLTLLLTRGGGHWMPALPVLGGAMVVLAPLWLVPAVVFAVVWHRRAAEGRVR